MTKNAQSTADRNSPVFIIGGSRTGSEMLKTVLSMSPELDFVDEMFLLCPRWLHKDLRSNIREHVGDLAAPDALDRLLDLLFSGKPYGWFWSVAETQLDRERLRKKLEGNALDLREIFDAIMAVHSTTRGKTGIGAKFPVHYSLTYKLLEWFPDCRLIHTTRNPKAVYASQSVKYLREDQSELSKRFSMFQQFVHINLQTARTAKLDKTYSGESNYRLVRYEDVVREPEVAIRELCDFLKIRYLPEMLSPNQYGSSFTDIGGNRGIEESSLFKWKSSLSRRAIFTMDLLQKNAYRQLGYDLDGD